MLKLKKSILDKRVTPHIPIATERAFIEGLSQSRFLTWHKEPVPIHSGIASRLLVGGRADITDSPALLEGFARLVASTAWTLSLPRVHGRTRCLVGVPTTGTALAVSAAGYGHYRCPVRVMREQLRESHGASRGWTDAPPNDYHWYITVDNTITRGDSLLQSISRLREDGYPVNDMGHICLVDRAQGGVNLLKEQGVTVTPIFTITALLDAFNEVNPVQWTDEIVDAAKADLEDGKRLLQPLFA